MVLIRDDRDEIAQLLLRYGDANGDGWADVALAVWDPPPCPHAATSRNITIGVSRNRPITVPLPLLAPPSGPPRAIRHRLRVAPSIQR